MAFLLLHLPDSLREYKSKYGDDQMSGRQDAGWTERSDDFL
jgi:hypothetical protein